MTDTKQPDPKQHIHLPSTFRNLADLLKEADEREQREAAERQVKEAAEVENKTKRREEKRRDAALRAAKEAEEAAKARKSRQIPTLTDEERELFASYIDKTASTEGCHLWVGTRDSGYAVFRVGGVYVRARSIVYADSTGRAPVGHLFNVCLNRLCVNPEHVILKRGA